MRLLPPPVATRRLLLIAAFAAAAAAPPSTGPLRFSLRGGNENVVSTPAPSTNAGGFLSYHAVQGAPYDVTYDGRSFIVAG
jgi:hypothetical protein